ncbi:hypothetical protein [Streptomyces sp. NPDC019224]|uniref:hypothetical protein n=1 Tax=Streptomyces sp. NPDC019224 TaxID=3154484 RepID=UPI0033DDC06A
MTTDDAGIFDEQPRTSRDPRDPIPSPWESFSAIAELVHRRKVGVIAEHGTSEASLGTDLAVYAAQAGIPTLLCSARRPPQAPPLLRVDTRAHPTPAHINDLLRTPHRGRELGFLVIESYERLRSDEQPAPDRYDPVDDLDYEPPTAAEQLLRSVQLILPGFPSLFTTLVPSPPDPTRPSMESFGIDHPASVLTDACKPVLMLRRTDPHAVQARIELGSHPGPQLVTIPWPAQPAMRTLHELRHALSLYGAAEDRARFDADISAVDLDDLDQLSDIVRTYRQRVKRQASMTLPAQQSDEPARHETR